MLVLLISGFGPAAVGQSFLRANGPKIVNASGQEVVLNGVNLGGWLLQEGYIIKPGWPGIDGRQTQGTVKKTLYNAGHDRCPGGGVLPALPRQFHHPARH